MIHNSQQQRQRGRMAGGRLCWALLTCLPWAMAAPAQQTAFVSWDRNENLRYYYVYYRDGATDSRFKVSAGINEAAVICGLKEGHTYYFAVSGVDAEGLESEPSPEIKFVAPGGLRVEAMSQTGLRLQFAVAAGHRYEVQATEDLKSWQTVNAVAAGENNWMLLTWPLPPGVGARFYRLAQY